MRNAFAEQIVQLAGHDDRIVLLSGDIGNRLFNTFKERFPDRFFNCGVAEANMMSVAGGLALSGMRPVVYTIAPFTTLRCFEQIKIDVCYNGAPVIIVGVGAGLSYASLGPTHHAFEDIGALRLFPGMSVVCPADAWEVKAGLQAGLAHEGPVYLRLGKKGEPLVHERAPEFVIGKVIPLREGRDVCLLGTGNIVPHVMEAAADLDAQGVSSCVASVHTVKPLDLDFLTEVFHRFRLVVTVEEHSLLGGLGGGVAEWLADMGPQQASLLRIGMQDEFLHEAGDQEFARRHFGLTPDILVAKVRTKWREIQGQSV